MFQGGYLEVIHEDAFKNLHIKFLDISQNEIEKTDEEAFKSLSSSLHKLNLADNELHEFPVSALRYLKQLQYLNLDNNKISRLEPSEFQVNIFGTVFFTFY